MKKLRNILLAFFSLAMVFIFGIEVFAAVVVNFSITGHVEYYPYEIGAKIWATTAYIEGAVRGDSSYLILNGEAGAYSNNIYTISGAEQSYSNITTSLSNVVFANASDQEEILIFLKNEGDRYIIPSIEFVASQESQLSVTTEYYYFDISETGQQDPLTIKANSASSTAFVSSIQTEITGNHYSAWTSSSSIDNHDVLCIRILIAPRGGVGDINTDFAIYIGFMADVQYSSNEILSIYQTIDSDTPTWTKYGFNATLNASATKLVSNSMSNLYVALRDETISYGTDDYLTDAPVYRDRDLVNVDIKTGEIIGKLSNSSYEFEWFGREIELMSGTTLASGRTLTQDETFTVDVYTYYPTMYIRRWIVGNEQWLSISDEEFAGAVEVPEYYVATFESTIFNPDKTVATNTSGNIIPRSYVFERGTITLGAVARLQNYYGYSTYSGSTATTSQTTMLTWTGNLTSAWAASGLNSAYRQVKAAQGENWKAFVYNLLYLVKYADNNAQTNVGQGNVLSNNAYNAVKTSKLKSVTGADISIDVTLESIIGSGQIAVYNSSRKGTATYDSANNYRMSDTGYNVAGLNYGYNSLYTNGNDVQGIYTHQFLIKEDAETRKICDGMIGSDGYSSVFCLGMCNAWGNAWTWMFGGAILYDGSSAWAYINFDDYDYSNPSTSWYTSDNNSGFSDNDTMLTTTRHYIKLSYNLATATNFFRYNGTATIQSNPFEMLIGLPSGNSSLAGSATGTTGLCDYYYFKDSTTIVFGMGRGGSINNAEKAGPLYFAVDNPNSHTHARFGFRTGLVNQ